MMNEQDDSNEQDSLLDDEQLLEISKSQRKRDADAIRELGAQLAALGASELATVPLPDDVLAAISELNRIKAQGARKRQLGFLAKRMRQIDIEPIEAAMENLRLAARANTVNLHRVEHWRDRLLGDTPEQNPKQALTEFLDEYADADRQHFRHLQRQALREREGGRAPAAARQLFKAIRDLVIASPAND